MRTSGPGSLTAGLNALQDSQLTPDPLQVAQLTLTPMDGLTSNMEYIDTQCIHTLKPDNLAVPIPLRDSASTGWPEPTPPVKAPGTKDGKSRFFPTSSTESADSNTARPSQSSGEPTNLGSARLESKLFSKSKIEAIRALSGSDVEMMTGETDALFFMDDETPTLLPSSPGRSEQESLKSRGSTGEFYESRIEAVRISVLPTPSRSENGWEGLDEAFWTCK